MKSKVILFCVVLFCSQIVDSIPRRDGRFQHRVQPQGQVDQNAPNTEYVETLKKPAIDQEGTQNDYLNQGYNNDGNGYDKNPDGSSSSSSSSGPERIYSPNLKADRLRLDSYLPIDEAYPSQVAFDSQHLRNKNWHLQPNHNEASTNRRGYQPNRSSQPLDSIDRREGRLRQGVKLRRQVDQNAPNTEYVETLKKLAIDQEGTQNDYLNQGYNNDGNGYDKSPDGSSLSSSSSGPEGIYSPNLKADGRRLDSYLPIDGAYPSQVVFDSQHLRNKNWDLQPNYNVASKNRRVYQPNRSSEPSQYPVANNAGDSYVGNSGFGTSGPVPYKNYMSRLTNYDYSSALISELDNYRSDSEPINAPVSYDSNSLGYIPNNGPVPYEINGEDQAVASEAILRLPKGGRRHAQINTAHANTGKKAVDISKILSVTPRARKYEQKYRSDSGNSKIDDIYAVISENIEETSGNYEDGSSSSTSSNNNQNHDMNSNNGIKELNLNNLLTQQEIQKILSENDKRYVILHPNGTVEYMDKINLQSLNSVVHLVNTKRKHVGDTKGDGAQSLDNVPNNIPKTFVPPNESPLRTNNQPAHVNQTNPADKSDSNLPIKGLPGDHNNLNPLTQLVNQPGKVNDTKSSSPRGNKPAAHKSTLFSDENQSDDDKERHTTGRHLAHRKSNPSQGKKPAYGGNDSSQLTTGENQLLDAKNSKRLPWKEHQSENDSDSKPSDKSQQRDDNKSEPLYSQITENKSGNDYNSDLFEDENQSEEEIWPEDFKPSQKSHPYKIQPTDDSKSNLPGLTETVQKSDFTTLSPTALGAIKGLPGDHNNWNPLIQLVNQPGKVNDTNSSSPRGNKPAAHKSTLLSDENQSDDDKERHTTGRHLAHRKSNPSQGKKPAYGGNDSSLLTLDENQVPDAKNSKPLPWKEHQSENDSDSKPSDKNQQGDYNKSEPLYSQTTENKSGNDYNSDLSEDENQSEEEIWPEDRKPSQKSPPYKREPTNDSKPNLPGLTETVEKSDFTTLSPTALGAIKGLPGDHNNWNPLIQLVNQPGKVNDTNSSSPRGNKPAAHKSTLLSDENQSDDDKERHTTGRHLAHRKSNPSQGKKPAYGGNGSSLLTLDENQVPDAKNSKPLPWKEHQSENDSDSKPSDKNQQGDYNKSEPLYSQTTENKSGNDYNSDLSEDENQSEEEIWPEDRKPSQKSPPYKREPTNDSKPNLPGLTETVEKSDSTTLSSTALGAIKGLPGDHNNLNPLTQLVNQPGKVNDTKSSSPRGNKPAAHKSTLLSDENQSDDDKEIHITGGHLAHRKSNPSQGKKPAYGGNDSSLLNPGENQLSDAKNSKPLPWKEHQSENDSDSKPSDKSQQRDDNKSKPLRSHKKKLNHNIKRKPSHVKQLADDHTSHKNKSGNDYNSGSLSEDENQPEDRKPSNQLHPYKKQPTDDSKPTLSGLTETDGKSDSTILSPTATKDTTSPKSKNHKYTHHHRKSTPSSEETSEDQNITLSPIAQVTDNVRDVQPLTTTTTTAKPIEILEKDDTIKDANNKQDDERDDASSSSGDLASILDTLQTSTTTASPSTSATPVDNSSNDKTTKETAENKGTQTNDKAIKSQGINGKKYIQTVQSAVYDSTELLDTNTEVPAESDDYSPVKTSPSVYNDVDSGDASGDNTLELEQPETDLTITVSSSPANDSEDEIITINIEISESTGLASNNKTLLVSIDTDNKDDDDAKTPKSSGSGSQSSDCNKDHNDDDGRDMNLEIDLSNIQGEPTIWIRTTNQDFIDKLTDKNDTSFDIVYFINNIYQPAVERVKETTIHCNGTVVIESKEITYANKDDPTPTITKRTQTVQIEDYKRIGLDLS